MHVQADRLGLVARLYDGVNDSPNELSIGPEGDGRVWLTLVDRDGGNTELTLVVDRDELLAAIALTTVPNLSVDAPDGGIFSAK